MTLLRNLYRCTIILILVSIPAFAQNGWESIGRNDNREARRLFTERLKADSTDRDALKGLIYLAELEGDPHSYIASINTLIRHHWEEPIFLLFRDSYDGPIEEALNSGRLSEQVKADARIRMAQDLKADRKFAEAEKVFGEHFGRYDWSLLGPFKNPAGSAHAQTFPVEKEPYDAGRTYIDESGLELKWLTPEYCGRNGEINFTKHLLERVNDTYFANTFLTTKTPSRVQLRLGRSAPVKIWLDDHQVYESADPIAFEYDGEIIELDLPAGTHRLLVKLSAIPLYVTRDDEYDLFEFFDSPDFNQDVLSIRLTDTSGALLRGVESRASGNYTPARYDVTVRRLAAVEYYRKRIEAEPGNWFNYYALCKAFMNYGMVQESEEFFVKALRRNPENVCLKYLAAKSYATNGKIEAAYNVLNGVDMERTPIYSILFDRLQEIDMDNEEDRYLAALNTLRGVAPSNYQIISLMVSYYVKKDMDEERDAFIDSISAAYPTYADYLEPQKSIHDVEERHSLADDERRSQVDSLRSVLKDRYLIDDYETVIDYYRDQNDHDEVVRLYDEVIGGSPYTVRYRLSKSYELFENKRFAEALRVMDTVLTIAPHNESALELVGDIYDQMKDKQRALEYYRKVQRSGQRGYYFNNSVESKIEKIEGPRAYKSFFDTKGFAEVLADKGWLDRYKGEEAVVLMYTRDMIMDTNEQIRTYSRMMVKILSEAGANTWTQTGFGYMGDLDFVKVVKANGAEVVPDRRGDYVVFKNLVPGDLIQIEGQDLSSPSQYFDHEFFDISVFGFSAPVYYSKLEVMVPKGKYLGVQHHRLPGEAVKSVKGSYDSYRWEYSTLPKIAEEDAVIDRMDLYRNVFVSTMPDWSKVVDWYSRLTYRKFEPTYDIIELVDSVVDDNMSQEEKVIAVYNYITKEVNYSSVPFLQSAHIPKKSNLTLSARIGDCKDVATLMITMLRAAGVEAYYTLVKTNTFTHQKILPSIYFNHVIVAVELNGKMRYLDLVTDFYPHYVLPQSDAGAWALLVKKGETALFQLPQDDLDAEKNTAVIDVEATLNIDRSLDLEVKTVSEGIRGGDLREHLYATSPDEHKNYILASMGEEAFTDLHLVDWKYENQTEITEPLRASYTFNSARFSDKVSNLLIFRIPYMVSIPTSKALLSKTRQNDLNLTEIADVTPVHQRVLLRFPKGYTLTEFPQDISVAGKYGSYKVRFTKHKEGLMIEKQQQFFVTQVPATEFDAFKEFYLRILDIDAAKYAVMGKR